MKLNFLMVNKTKISQKNIRIPLRPSPDRSENPFVTLSGFRTLTG
jgi:hypothetical protein